MKKTGIMTMLFTVVCMICSAKTISSNFDGMIYSVTVPYNWNRVVLGTDGSVNEILTVQGPDGSFVSLQRTNFKVPISYYRYLTPQQRTILAGSKLKAFRNMMINKGFEVENARCEFIGDFNSNYNSLCTSANVGKATQEYLPGYQEEDFLKDHTEYKTILLNCAQSPVTYAERKDELFNIKDSLCVFDQLFMYWITH